MEKKITLQLGDFQFSWPFEYQVDEINVCYLAIIHSMFLFAIDCKHIIFVGFFYVLIFLIMYIPAFVVYFLIGIVNDVQFAGVRYNRNCNYLVHRYPLRVWRDLFWIFMFLLCQLSFYTYLW